MSGASLLGVLFIGHSLFGQANPAMVEQSLQALGYGTQVQAHIINGAPLKYNWEHATQAEGVNARAVLPGGGIDTLILTEGIPLANHLEWSDTGRYAMAFYGLAHAANPDVRAFVQETWHSLNSGSTIDVAYDDFDHIPWRDRLDRDLAAWEGIVAQMNAERPAGAAKVRLIPAGQAMALLYDEIGKGTVPGLAHIGNIFADDIHPSPIGDYFLTLVQVATLTGKPPTDVPRQLHSRWGGALRSPPAAQAARLKEIAWQAVSTYFDGEMGGEMGAEIERAVVAKDVKQDTGQDTGEGAGKDVAQASLDPVQGIADAAAIPLPSLAAPNAVQEIAIGLSPPSDWNPGVQFLDVMKTARPIFGHLPGQWGGVENAALRAEGVLDDNGWPQYKTRDISSFGTVILTDMPEAAKSLEGRYVLRFDGKGIVEVKGRASNIRYGKNEVSFDYTPGPGLVEIRIQRTSVKPGSKTYVRNIRVLRQDRIAAYEAGARFNPDWLARIEGFDTLRFMDWMGTNDSTQSTWAQRPRPDHATFAYGHVPVETMLALANLTGKDPWFNMPHLATDAYMRAFAETVRAGLDPGLRAYVEFSNEVWNWQFEQAAWADERARTDWQADEKGVQYYGMRAAQMAQIWRDVFDTGADARLRLVIASQTGWLGLEAEALEAPLWQAKGNPAPATLFDAYAVTGYFGGIIGTPDRAPMVAQWVSQSLSRAQNAAKEQGLAGQALKDYIAAHRFDHASALAGRELLDGGISGDATDSVSDLLTRVLPYHLQVAKRHDLDLIMYEGGTHVVGIGAQMENAALTEFFTHLNYTPEMGLLYGRLIDGWRGLGGQLFNAYSDIYPTAKWGSWGALRYLSDENPRWDALEAAQ